MQVFNIVFERLPMVWFLLGLLFNALALWIGFEASMFFVYLILGWVAAYTAWRCSCCSAWKSWVLISRIPTD